jgi:4-alpha-glucanotransferase
VSKINFALGIHNHQPVGNFDHVFQKAYERSYQPFLAAALDHPHIRFSLHTSGCLLEWLERHQKGYFDLVGKLVARKQVELLGGAFYEPILPILPREDALEQIERMRNYLQRRFGVKPRGAWLAERVWEPQLAQLLAEAGVEYLPLDDDHFLSAGHRLEDLTGYFLTEDGAGPVALFPIHKQLRYTIPFEEPEATLLYLRQHAEGKEQPLFVMADDGEKFGMWPKTYAWVYEKGWLNRFFAALEKHSDRIELLTLGEARDRIAPAGRTYLPTSSYFEMGEWVLPPKAGRRFEEYLQEFRERKDWDELRPFLKGGFWRGYFARYEEANNLHKKMLRTSRKYHRLSSRKQDDELQTPLLRGQCNCPYWHGVFGGLYLPHLRHAVWKELLRAEYEVDNSAHRGRKWVEIEKTDFDADGFSELLMENAEMNAYVAPQRGGMLFEWDYRPRGYNFLNTLTRRVETYHTKLAHAVSPDSVKEKEKDTASIHDLVLTKEPNLTKALHYDRWPRAALLDHFPGWNSTIEEFRDGTLADYGNFLQEPYELAELFTDAIALRRRGTIGGTPTDLTKTLRVLPGKAVLNVRYQVRNLAPHELNSPFGVEWNLALMAASSPRHTLSLPDLGVKDRMLGEAAEHLNVHDVVLTDRQEGVMVRFEFPDPVKVWRVPIESVSLSEGGFERIFQSVALLFMWELHLAPGQEWERRFTASLSSI